METKQPLEIPLPLASQLHPSEGATAFLLEKHSDWDLQKQKDLQRTFDSSQLGENMFSRELKNLTACLSYAPLPSDMVESCSRTFGFPQEEVLRLTEATLLTQVSELE